MTPTIERVADEAARTAATQVAARLGAVPGVTVLRSGTEIAVRGRGLARRRIEEPALRWPGGVR